MNKDESLTWHKRLGGDEIVEKNGCFFYVYIFVVNFDHLVK